jgi:branched-chain amino acid aminotransferase
MERVIYMSGKLVPAREARVNVFDHGFLYGDGVFEGIRIYGGKPFRLDKHTRRLYDSAAAIRLHIPLTPGQMDQAVLQTLAANADLKEGYIRLIVTRGVGSLGINPLTCQEPQIIIIVDTIALYPPEAYQKGLDVVTGATIRNHPAALSPRIKSMNYLNNIMANIEGLDAGAADTRMLNNLGYVAEATGDNVFLVRLGQVYTPDLASSCLGGVTREEVIDLCRELGRPVHETQLTRYDLYAADECFLTGTAAEVVPVARIDGRPVGSGAVGPITAEIIAAFHKRIRSA